jgi:hypothetical protein
VRKEAAEKLRAVWQSKSFDSEVIKYCSYSAFQDLKLKLEAADGHNNFQDQ